ncbi:glycosyl transferase family 1 [Candidatus Epulonipiscium fishelsonii]|nr:glycosyl transferase family 1 [Epulopiscium sp. SCG-C06WGA-EpuloA1]
MKIALAHFRVGETDGVSLEMDKWKYVLEKNGHECIYIAGSEGTLKAHIIPQMHYQGEVNNKIVHNCYKEFVDYENIEQLKKEIFEYAAKIEVELSNIISKENIDIVVVNNIWSLGWHLPAGIAFTNVAKKHPKIKFVGHNHDFYWERVLYSNPKVDFVRDILEEYFVPNLENTSHCVINKIAQEQVLIRKGIETVVVPNVFDFNQPVWREDEYNGQLRNQLDINKDDIVILQATRITERKAIEFGIEVVAKINDLKKDYVGKTLYNGQIFKEDSKIYYVFAGLNESAKYMQTLLSKMNQKNINFKYINELVDHSRGLKDNQKVYSLWDTYVISDFVTYPSILEGWGNQLLEAMFAKKPLIVYEYPVFEKDLKSNKIEYISLGNSYSGEEGDLKISDEIVEKASKEALAILFDKTLYDTQTTVNYEIGKKHYSYEALENILINKFRGIYNE